MNVTILTPTYNRADNLNNLYESLVKQTNCDFKWLIIDDGSVDNTKEIVESYIKESKIKIVYKYKENGGKHRAINYGMKYVDTDLTFIVDSDDYLTENAIDLAIKFGKKYINRKDICGFSFLRCFPNGEINGMKFPKDEYISDYISCRLNEEIMGDKAEVYYTKIFKQYKFKEVDGEKFLFEDYIWIQMAEKYKTVHINIPIYVGDYLSDGLTKNIEIQKYNSPKGMMYRAEVMCSKKCNLKVRIKGIIMYTSYGFIAGYKSKKLFKNSKYKRLFIYFYLLGIINYFRLKINNSL